MQFRIAEYLEPGGKEVFIKEDIFTKRYIFRDKSLEENFSEGISIVRSRLWIGELLGVGPVSRRIRDAGKFPAPSNRLSQLAL